MDGSRADDAKPRFRIPRPGGLPTGPTHPASKDPVKTPAPSEAKAVATPKPQAEATAEPKTESTPEPRTEAAAKLELEAPPRPELRAPKLEPKPSPKLELKAPKLELNRPKLELEAPEPEPKPTPKPEVKAAPERDPGAPKLEPRPTPQVGLKAPKAELKATKIETKTAPEQERETAPTPQHLDRKRFPRPTPKPDTRAAPKLETAPKGASSASQPLADSGGTILPRPTEGSEAASELPTIAPPRIDPPQDFDVDVGDAEEYSAGAPISDAPPSASPSTIPPPNYQKLARFGRFDLLGQLASGGMANIYLARESGEQGASRFVVIKVIRGEFSEESEFAQMFLNEGRIAMRLTHPNICTVYECGRNSGRFFMAMEFVSGETLRDLLARAGKQSKLLPIPVLLKLFAVIAEALDFAHRARDADRRPLNIVHRDVSPQNIMIRYDGVAKLLDFGVAKAERSEHATEAGAVKGKFSYMSPEQAKSDPLDGRSDIFSLATCLYEAITMRRLFRGNAPIETLTAVLKQKPPPLERYRDDVPPGLDAILQKALAKDPDDRYQRASDLQEALEQLLADSREAVSTSRIAAEMEALFAAEIRRGPVLETEGLDKRFPTLSFTLQTATEDLAPLRERPKRTGLIVGAGAAIALAAGLAWFVATGAGNGPPPAVATPPTVAVTPPALPDPPPPPIPEPSPEIVPQPEPLAPVLETGEGPDEPGEPAPEEAVTTGEEPEQAVPTTGQLDPAEERRREERRQARREARERERAGGGSYVVTDPGF